MRIWEVEISTSRAWRNESERLDDNDIGDDDGILVDDGDGSKD